MRRRTSTCSTEEMERAFRPMPGALENTGKIADRCKVEFTFGHYHLPAFTPAGRERFSDVFPKSMCAEGFAGRYGEGRNKPKAQLEYDVRT